jgi:hypothetical protein
MLNFSVSDMETEKYKSLSHSDLKTNSITEENKKKKSLSQEWQIQGYM